MSLRENEQRRPRRAVHALIHNGEPDGRQRVQHPLLDDADEIFTFKQWVALNKLSERTGRRILKAPGGPTVTLLSKRRFGISRRANREWQASRERA